MILESVEMKELIQLVNDGRNVMLFGPDSSDSLLAINNYFLKLQRNGKKVAILEISDNWSASDFSNHIYRATKETFYLNATEMSVNWTYQDIMKDALYLVDAQCEEQGTQATLVLKEFHLLEKMVGGRVDAAFRTIIQRTQNISFVFMSSNNQALSRMFIHKSKPLYGMASSINFSD